MKNRIFLIFILLLVVMPPLYAQQKVTGTVKDVNKQPIVGASVVVEGTTSGTTTAAGGKFTLTVPAGAERALIVSFIGYNTERVKIGGGTTVDVILKESASDIEEVVVVGYGAMRKSDLTGSVSSVKINDVDAAQATSFDKLLQGRAAGVQVTIGNAAPGGAVNINIRGKSTFNGSGEPLYVVDGVILNPASSDTNVALLRGGRTSSTQESQNSLSMINPQDIANIEILKDASATAIYGSQGANGVVLITTKVGTSKKARIEISSTWELSRMSRYIDMLEFDEYARYLHDVNPASTFDPAGKRAVNWQKYASRTALSHNQRFSISGRSDKDNYYISGNYMNNQGTLRNTGLDQTNFRINYDRRLTRYLKLGTKTGFTFRRNTMTQGTEATGSQNSSMIRQMVNGRPFFATRTDEWDQETIEGVDKWLRDYDDQSKEYSVTPSIYGEIYFMRGLTFRSTVGAVYRDKMRLRYYGPLLTSAAAQLGCTTRAGLAEMTTFIYNIDNTLTFNRKFGSNHSLTAMVGMSLSDNLSKNTVIEGQNLEPWELRGQDLTNASITFAESYNENKNSLLSYFGRVIYSFKDRYILTATFRSDGSSKFAKGNKYSYFPSFAFAWRVNEEHFLQSAWWLSNLKLRAGWGQVGNQAVASYQTLANYSTNQTPAPGFINGAPGYITGIGPSNNANPDLKWETTEQVNLGVDMGFFSNRLSLTVDFYNKVTRDLLQSIQLPPSIAIGSSDSAVTTKWVNRGKILNRGVEFTLDAVPVTTRNFTWSINGNLSLNRNKVLDMGLAEGKLGSLYGSGFIGPFIGASAYFNAPANIFIEGSPVGMFFGFKTHGIVQESERGTLPTYRGAEQEPGMFHYLDQNGDGNVDDDDRTIIGDPNPKFIGGFGTTLTYKKLSLDVMFNGVYGNQIANGNNLTNYQTLPTNNNNVARRAYVNAWTPERPDAPMPKLGGISNAQVRDFPDWIIEDGSFLRLANVTLSYSFSFPKLKWISSLRVSVTGRNLWVLSDYSGFDPEVNSFGSDPGRVGVDWASYPNNKALVFSVSATF